MASVWAADHEGWKWGLGCANVGAGHQGGFQREQGDFKFTLGFEFLIALVCLLSGTRQVTELLWALSVCERWHSFALILHRKVLCDCGQSAFLYRGSWSLPTSVLQLWLLHGLYHPSARHVSLQPDPGIMERS